MFGACGPPRRPLLSSHLMPICTWHTRSSQSQGASEASALAVAAVAILTFSMQWPTNATLAPRQRVMEREGGGQCSVPCSGPMHLVQPQVQSVHGSWAAKQAYAHSSPPRSPHFGGQNVQLNHCRCADTHRLQPQGRAQMENVRDIPSLGLTVQTCHALQW